MSAVLDSILATILDTVAEPAMHALIHFLWQGSVVAIVLGIVLLSLRRRSAAARYQCACWALAVMVVLPCATAVRFEWNVSRADTPATHAGPAGDSVLAGDIDPGIATTATRDARDADGIDGAGTAVPGPAATLQPRDTNSAIKQLAQSTQQTVTDATSTIAGTLLRQLAWNPRQTDTARWVLGFWLAGVCLLSIVHMGGWFRVQRLRNSHVEPVPETWQDRADVFCRQLGISRAVRVLRSVAVDGPMVIGYLKPVVLIPVSAVTGLPARQLECILAHELAHIWRRDYLVNILQIVAETLLFFHPAVWWVSRQIRAERENCCDDIAVQLAGDRFAYARALVDLEELRLASPRLALGAGDGPLLRRVQRLVGGPDMSMYSSRNLLVGTLAAMLILIGGAVLALAAQERLGEVVAMATSTEEEQISARGGWSAERYDDELYMEIRERGDRNRRNRGRWNMTLHVDLDDFAGLTFTEDAVFSLVREAGTFRFTGDFEGPERRAEGDGRFTFAADPVFADQLGELGTRRLDDEEILVLAAQNLRVQTVQELRDLGYGPFDADELVTIAIFEVTPEFIDEMEREGYKDLDLDTLVAMRVHDVDADFVDTMRRAGIETYDEDDLIAWAVHDINPEFIRDIRAQFGENLDLDDVMSFKIHGVDGDFAREMERAGLDLDPEELLSFKIHGVDSRYADELRQEFGRDMDADDILSYKIHGMNPDYVRDLENAGLRGLDADELLSMKIHGVDGRYVQQIRDQFGQDMDADEILSFKIHGMSPGYVRDLENAGLDNLDADELLSMKIHGVTPAYIDHIRELGYRLDADELLSWKIHGVTGEYIAALAEMGYRDIDAEDLLDMRIHGVSPSWIKRLHARGLDDLDEEDLIKLRISGVEF